VSNEFFKNTGKIPPTHKWGDYGPQNFRLLHSNGSFTFCLNEASPLPGKAYIPKEERVMLWSLSGVFELFKGKLEDLGDIGQYPEVQMRGELQVYEARFIGLNVDYALFCVRKDSQAAWEAVLMANERVDISFPPANETKPPDAYGPALMWIKLPDTFPNPFQSDP